MRFATKSHQAVSGATSLGPFAENTKWGLVPSRAKDASIGNKLANDSPECIAQVQTE